MLALSHAATQERVGHWAVGGSTTAKAAPADLAHCHRCKSIVGWDEIPAISATVRRWVFQPSLRPTGYVVAQVIGCLRSTFASLLLRATKCPVILTAQKQMPQWRLETD